MTDVDRTAAVIKGIEGKRLPIGGLTKPRRLRQLAGKLYKKILIVIRDDR